MRMRRLTWIIALAVAIMSVVMTAALAAGGEKPLVVRSGNLILSLNADVSPKALPRTKLVPITFHLKGSIATTDGSQPPALKEFILDTGRTATIDTRGVPVCTLGKLVATDTQRAEAVCKGAIIGRGNVTARVAFPESTPFSTTGPLVLFNGGTRKGKTRIFVHAYLKVPAPTAVIETVVISKEHKGPFNLHTFASVPPVAGGNGSLTRVDLTINRNGYLLASCSGGEFLAHTINRFSDGTQVSGGFVRACKAIG